MVNNHAIVTELNQQPRILLIEDDESIASLIHLHLKDSYSIETAYDGQAGFTRAQEGEWAMILLDLRLPSKDGLEICRDLRAFDNNTPILMLTSRSSELDRVLGLEMGADDYLVKPFSLLELEARIKALLRRANVSPSEKSPEQHLSWRDIRIDTKTREAFLGEAMLELTAKEFELLGHFLRHPKQVFSRSQLLESVWGYGHSGYEHTVNSHINRLRAKIEKQPAEPEVIVTVWGVGYKLGV